MMAFGHKDNKDLTEVETKCFSTLQFSTLVEHTPEKILIVVVVSQQSKSYDTSRHRIVLIFGQKLDIDKLRKLTEPDFPKKIWITQ